MDSGGANAERSDFQYLLGGRRTDLLAHRHHCGCLDRVNRNQRTQDTGAAMELLSHDREVSHAPSVFTAPREKSIRR